MSKTGNAIEGVKVGGILLTLYIAWLIFRKGGIIEKGAAAVSWWLIQPEEAKSLTVDYWTDNGLTAENMLNVISGITFPWMSQMTAQEGYNILWGGYYETTPGKLGLAAPGTIENLSIYDPVIQVKFGKAIEWAAEQLALYTASAFEPIEQPEPGGEIWNW